MARPKQAEYRKRKRQAEEALARAQSSSMALASTSALPNPPRATLPPGRPASNTGGNRSMTQLPEIGEVVFVAGDTVDGDDDSYSDDEADGGLEGEDAIAEEMNVALGEEIDEDAEEEQEDGPPKKKAKKNAGGGARVLPVADLPDDWEGDAQDGATYLALVMRADKALPTYTRAINPYAETAVEEANDAPSPMMSDEDSPEPEVEAGPSRHPALPKESWQVAFPLHFVQYKTNIAESWPPSPPLPYPPTWPKIPPTSQRGEWGFYINGYPRRPIPAPTPPVSIGKGKGEAVDVEEDEEAGINGGGGEGANGSLGDEEDMEMDEDDEESAMNLPQEEILREVLEPWGEKHKARDPHVCILQKLDTPQIISVLSTLTTHIQNTLTPLETDLIPPSYDPLTAGSLHRPHTRKNPYSEHYSRWIFALLLVLDPFLSAAQISVLRELARVIIRVGGWRWVEAVVSGEVGLPASASATASGDSGSGAHWMLGARWKYARDSRHASGITEAESAKPAKEQISPNKREEHDETGVDETLARCWLVVHAIAAGWGQKDLVMDLEDMFS